MNILYVTFEAPALNYGGGIGVFQSLSSILEGNTVTYIGPKFDFDIFLKDSFDEVVFLTEKKDFCSKVLNIILARPVLYYESWEKSVGTIDPKKYDVLFVDSSKYDFVVRWGKRHRLTVISRIHNIEYDYLREKMRTRYPIHSKMAFFINSFIIKYREKNSMHMSDGAIFLTHEDKNRAENLYGTIPESTIIPVCFYPDNSKYYNSIPQNEKYILMTGSLWFGPNIEGMLWFIEKVWKELEKNIPKIGLVVAGGNPNKHIVKACKEAKRCKLIDSPKDMDRIFNNAVLYIAPIFEGAGMKVKVAESFKYGIFVIGTPLALQGYQEAIGYYSVVCSEKEFGDEIILRLHDYENKSDGFEILRKEIINVFGKYYSMNRSKRDFNSFINSIISR